MRESHKISNSTLVICTVTIVFMAILSIRIALNKVTESKSGNYLIPTYQQGMITRIVPQTPLNMRLFSNTEIMDFSAEAIQETLTLSFDDYLSSMTNSSELYFTETGWEQFSNEIKQSKIYSTLFSNKEVVTIVPKRVPFLLYSGTSDGFVDGVLTKDAYWTWRVQYTGILVKRPVDAELNQSNLSISGNINKSRSVQIEMTIDLQRVPKGKGARAVKIIGTHDWKTIWNE